MDTQGELSSNTPSTATTLPGRLRRTVTSVLVLLGAVTCVTSLVLLATTAQDARRFAAVQLYLVLVNLAGVLVLVVLIGRKLYDLRRDWRLHVPGSRMKARAVAIFSALALPPIILVYLFSLNAIYHGIDSWFDVDFKYGRWYMRWPYLA